MGQIYARDFKMIDQSDLIVSLIPPLPSGKPALSSGVERELQHASEGVLEFALDAAGEGGLAAGQRRDETDDQVRLVDHLEIAGVDLAHDVAADLNDVGGFQRHLPL